MIIFSCFPLRCVHKSVLWYLTLLRQKLYNVANFNSVYEASILCLIPDPKHSGRPKNYNTLSFISEINALGVIK